MINRPGRASTANLSLGLKLAFVLSLLILQVLPHAHQHNSPSHAEHQESPERTVPVLDAWVEFVDKDVYSERKKRRIYQELENSFHPKALERRKMRRTFPGLFDERDIPLAASYLRAVRAEGARLLSQSRWLNGVAIQATQRQIDRIRLLPCVKNVLHARERTLTGSRISSREELPPPPLENEETRSGFYGRSRIQVEQLGIGRLHAAGFTGKGIIVAVVDSGFDLTHPAFRFSGHPIRVVGQRDVMNDDPITATQPGEPPWGHSHGTYVLGAIAAYLPQELMGTAYDASFLLVKAEDDVEEYFLEEYWFVTGLEYAEAQGADIISSSLTIYFKYEQDQLDGRTAVMSQGWEIASGNGVIGLQGAGNHGHDLDPSIGHLGPPADAFGILAVGAVSPDGRTTRFSSDGPTADGRLKPEIMALGYPVWTVSLTDHERFVPQGGTSLATPLIAGGIACLLQAHPRWTTAELFESLFQSCPEYQENGSPDSLLIRGYGIPDFYRAAHLGKK